MTPPATGAARSRGRPRPSYDYDPSTAGPLRPLGPARRSSTTAVGTIYELSSATTAKSYDRISVIAYDVNPAVNTS